jgi:hypothetical protein
LRREITLQDFNIPGDRLEQVVEIMRHTAGELAQGFHFLRLA